MSREIKFRAWDIKKNKFVTDNYDWCINPLGEFCWTGEGGGTEQADGYEITQFTGLKDKNGKEIYEGDFVKQHHYYDSFGTTKEDYFQTGYVKFGAKHKKLPMFVVAYKSEYHETLGETEEEFKVGRMEVIGNIYENPELLK